VSQSELSQKQVRQRHIGDLHASIKRYNGSAKLYYKIHQTIGSIDYLVVLDHQTDLAAALAPSGTPEDRARQFLVTYYHLFSFARPDDQEQRRIFDSELFLKHTLRSRMGTHCIFSWRDGPLESADEHNFVVHLDTGNRVALVASVYPDDFEHQSHPHERIARRRSEMKLDKAFEGMRHELARLKQERQNARKVVYEPIAYDKCTRSGLRVKLTTDAGDRVMEFDIAGQKMRDYSIDVHSGPDRLGMGKVYRRFWSPDRRTRSAPLDEVLKRETSEVVLRDLKSDSELVGRYVAVIDQVQPDLPVERSHAFLNAPERSSSSFDRQMTYYHVDLIQRYFRAMGLDALDAYHHLNPLQVVLKPSGLPRYASNEERIHIPALGVDEMATHALDARILYHEFVHAVTDALARINRHDHSAVTDPRYREIIQAMAMDEGLGDYFACSLAVRVGAEWASFIPLMFIRDERLAWETTTVRRLGGGRAEQYSAENFDLHKVFTDALPATAEEAARKGDMIMYGWGEQWGRYLWSLRCALGEEIADLLIAHSIFFLTRWATFGLGVLALALADRMLFEGAHQEAILKTGEHACDWEDEADLDRALERAPATGPRPSYDLEGAVPDKLIRPPEILVYTDKPLAGSEVTTA
jgi:hypothetical protein